MRFPKPHRLLAILNSISNKIFLKAILKIFRKRISVFQLISGPVFHSDTYDNSHSTTRHWALGRYPFHPGLVYNIQCHEAFWASIDAQKSQLRAQPQEKEYSGKLIATKLSPN